MSFNRDRRQAERTLGDNNCAFNSFILGLAQGYVLNEIYPRLDLDKEFIAEAAYALGVAADWESVKDEVMLLREVDKHQLQKQLQGPMRALAIRLGGADEQYKHASENHLLAAYDLFAGGVTVPRMQQDDIFARHDFILAKFQEVEDEAELKTWWREHGFYAFQAAMSCDGAWAGAQELGLLANYFNVNLEIERRGVVIEGFVNNGELDTTDMPADFVKELGRRNIIEQSHLDNPTQKFKVNTLEEIETRVREFEGIDAVRAFVVKDAAVPVDWSVERVAELVSRGVISSDGERFILNNESANKRMYPMPDVTRFMAVVSRDLILAPTIVLQNNNATHWNNMPDNPEPALEVKAEAVKEVEYTQNGLTFFVSIERQIQLDEELAKKIQVEDSLACKK